FSGSAETILRNHVDDVVADANLVFANSNINARYRLVGKVKLQSTDQPPATGIFDGLRWLSPAHSPTVDPDTVGPQEVLDLREEYAADVIALYVPLSWDDNNFCGVANLPRANGSIPFPGGQFGTRAFSVLRERCGRNDWTFAHEVGHNYAMRHNDEDTSATHLFGTGRGHNQSRTPWQSIANGDLELDVAGTFTVGYHFTPQVDGWVVGFGGLYQGSKRIRLWEDGVTQFLEERIVPSTNAWNYVQLARAVEVRAGTRYTVGVFTAGNGSIYRNIIPFPRSSGGITIHGTTAIPGDARPTSIDPNIMYGNVDIRFVANSDLTSGTLAASAMSCAWTDGTDITQGVCNRRPYLSDPGISLGGLPIGTSTRNNALVGRIQTGPYANFRTNGSPVCQGDFLGTVAGSSLPITFASLTANDSDPDGDTLVVTDYDRITGQGGSNSSSTGSGFTYNPPTGFLGTDWFFYTVSDRPPGHGAAQTARCAVTVQVVANTQVVGQVGVVTNLTHTPTIVLFGRNYTNPVVIASTPSNNGGDTSVVRITNVQSNSFTFFIDEAPNRDGPHTTETVGFVVVEAGTWQMGDGSILRAGKLATNRTVGRSVANQWQTVGYGGSFAATPVFFSQVQTNNDPSWVKTRHLSIGTSSARLGLEKAESDAVSHGTETVGWIAVEPGIGNWNGHPWVAGRTPNAVTHSWHTTPFTGASTPRLFAAMSTYDGPDNGSIRYRLLSTSSFQVRVEEDTTLDTETSHTSEVVDYLVLSGTGTFSGSPQ
ncbi:MAG: Ig-like domain-containing protein, partial [Holophagales bacterium]|nr:Ig-like domain-containing protein [Holophagales bacterium]